MDNDNRHLQYLEQIRRWPDGRLVKFSKREDQADGSVIFSQPYSKTYTRELGKKGPVICATVPRDGLSLIFKILESKPEPFMFLYVLVVSAAGGGSEGRYQFEDWVDRPYLYDWLTHHRDFLEQDGRHNLWILCGDQSQIVYDRHETLYLYGDPDPMEAILKADGYQEGEFAVDFAHSHHYHREFNHFEKAIAESEEFIFFPLVPEQDI